MKLQSQQPMKKYQAIQSAVMDLSTTSDFRGIKDVFESTGEKSEKIVAMPNGQLEEMTHKAKLPAMNDNAQEIDIFPSLKSNSLISICKLIDTGYTTVFHLNKGGVTVHWNKDIAIKVSKGTTL